MDLSSQRNGVNGLCGLLQARFLQPYMFCLLYKVQLFGSDAQIATMFAKSAHGIPAGEYHCPVLNKVFTEFTHIVAVKTTGNVFCYEVCL